MLNVFVLHTRLHSCLCPSAAISHLTISLTALSLAGKQSRSYHPFYVGSDVSYLLKCLDSNALIAVGLQVFDLSTRIDRNFLRTHARLSGPSLPLSSALLWKRVFHVARPTRPFFRATCPGGDS